MKVLVLFLATWFLFNVVAGWSLMLAVGIVHHEWIPQCPTIGFWWAFLLAGCLRGALYQINWSGSNRNS